MEDLDQNERLNELLISLYRSLLQYVAESSVWTDVQSEANAMAMQHIAAEQRQGVGRLTDLLIQRGCVVDFGVYPTEFTDLHYLALDFLYEQLEADETRLIARIEQAQAAASGDHAAAALLAELAAAEKSRLLNLRALANRQPAAA